MPVRLPDFLNVLRSRRAAARWSRAVAEGGQMSDADLAVIRPQARDMARLANAVLETADRRLLGPRIGGEAIDRPAHCDWAWRAGPWAARMTPAAHAGVPGGTVLAEGVRLFHDCPLSEITLRQTRAADPQAKAPYALSLDVLGFRGSFLSLAMDLPKSAATSLTRSHIVVLSTRLQMERPAKLFTRLNIRHGPNTEQLQGRLTPGTGAGGPLTAEFDLGFHDINPARLETAWIDLIFDAPAMSLVRIEDLTVSRRPRAEL